ncbi:hypothetical protein Bca101_046954 [Brassica carinata]
MARSWLLGSEQEAPFRCYHGGFCWDLLCLMARDSLGFMPLLCFVSASRWILSDSRLLMGVLHLCSHCFRRKSIIASCRFDTQSLVSLVLCLFDGTGVEPWFTAFPGRATSGVDFKGCGGRTRTLSTLLRLSSCRSRPRDGSDTKLKLRSPKASKLL